MQWQKDKQLITKSNKEIWKSGMNLDAPRVSSISTSCICRVIHVYDAVEHITQFIIYFHIAL